MPLESHTGNTQLHTSSPAAPIQATLPPPLQNTELSLPTRPPSLGICYLFIVCVPLPGRPPCRDGRGRAVRGCPPCPHQGRGVLSAEARRAGGPNGSPSGGRGPRAGARRPEAGAGENRLLNPLLAAAVAPRDAAGAGGGGSGSRGR